jgi:hypothetical protein
MRNRKCLRSCSYRTSGICKRLCHRTTSDNLKHILATVKNKLTVSSRIYTIIFG